VLKVVNDTTIATAPPKEGRFQFTKILGQETTQSEVFEATAK